MFTYPSNWKFFFSFATSSITVLSAEFSHLVLDFQSILFSSFKLCVFDHAHRTCDVSSCFRVNIYSCCIKELDVDWVKHTIPETAQLNIHNSTVSFITKPRNKSVYHWYEYIHNDEIQEYHFICSNSRWTIAAGPFATIVTQRNASQLNAIQTTIQLISVQTLDINAQAWGPTQIRSPDKTIRFKCFSDTAHSVNCMTNGRRKKNILDQRWTVIVAFSIILSSILVLHSSVGIGYVISSQ